MGIYNQIEGPVRAVLKMLLGDERLRKQITYRRYNDQSYSGGLGHEVGSFTESHPYAIRLKHTDRSMLAGVGRIQEGDQAYLIMFEDGPDNMSLKDEIVDENGATQTIKDITPIFGLAIALTIEGGY